MIPEKHTPSADREVEEALAALHRSISVSQIYPPNHPMLVDTLKHGYQAWRQMEGDDRWEEAGLQLRSGTLWLADHQLGEGSPALSSLARTFQNHGLMGIRRTGPLSLDGYGWVVSLLASSAEVLAPKGGIIGAWKEERHESALALRGLTVTAAGTSARGDAPTYGGRKDWGTPLSHNGETAALADPLLLSRLHSFKQRDARERRLLDLLLRLGRTEDITRFLDLLREVSRIVESYLEEERYREAFDVLLHLHCEAQNAEALGKTGKRDYLVDTVRLLVGGEFLAWLISQVASARDDEEAEIGEYILRAIGSNGVIPIINALVAERNRIGRRRLVDVLVSIGDPVVPYASKMLDDQRWFVVRNMVTVLGGVGSPEAVQALVRVTRDRDKRIRKEVARALGRPGAEDVPEAEAELLRLLEDPDPAVRLMAVSAAASRKTEQLLKALWRVFHRVGIRSGDLEFKSAVLRAMGRMGLPAGAEHLIRVARKRPLLWRNRWQVVQRAAIEALGDLGGEQPQALLLSLREHKNPELRSAAVRALAAIGDLSEGEPA
jgi:HEAT repeat protein